MLFREDCDADQLIDVILGTRKYVRCLYAYNKIDTVTMEEVDFLARQPHSVVISVHMRLNLDMLLQKMWDYMGLIRIYTKKQGGQPDLEVPVILSHQRNGTTIESVCKGVSKELLVVFHYAQVWGVSTKHDPQRVGLAHQLGDQDVVQLVGKTNNQQKHDKDYSQRVQAYNTKVAEMRKAKTKAGKAKRQAG